VLSFSERFKLAILEDHAEALPAGGQIVIQVT
jgi:hypothetical protein